jgi:acyl-CoA thioester hydrolase
VSSDALVRAGFPPYAFLLQPEWCDYNEHFSDGYYLVAFSTAAEQVLEALGLGARYRAQGRFSAYTVESQVRYLREAKSGDLLAIRQRLLRHDAKRIWLQQEMRRGETVLATCTFVYLHVDTSLPRAAPFPPDVLQRIAAHCPVETGNATVGTGGTPPPALP